MTRSEQQKLYKQRIDEECKAKGLCTNCRLRPAREGRKMCFVCAMACHNYYERRKNYLGVYQGVQGRRPIYLYIILDGSEEVFRGTSKECAEHFGLKSGNPLSYHFKNGGYLRNRYTVTRERIIGEGK